jgi:hypothetical protein
MLVTSAVALLPDWSADVPWLAYAVVAALLLVVRMLWRRATMHRGQAEWERRRRLELEAYSGLEVTLPVGAEPRKLVEQGKRVCRLIAEKSHFPKAALYLRSASGEMVCAGSCGMDDLTLAALDVWGERIVLEEGNEKDRDAERRGRDAVRSFSVVLGAREVFDAMPGQGCREATIVPLRMLRGRLVGALAVCSDGVAVLKAEQVAQAIVPLEVLGARLAGFVERTLLMQRLIEVERLAAAGQIVAGVARELTEPLAAVLGLAELMVESAAEPRVQQDAEMIVEQGMRMQEVLEGLRGFWRPRAVPADEGEEIPAPESGLERDGCA